MSSAHFVCMWVGSTCLNFLRVLSCPDETYVSKQPGELLSNGQGLTQADTIRKPTNVRPDSLCTLENVEIYIALAVVPLQHAEKGGYLNERSTKNGIVASSRSMLSMPCHHHPPDLLD